MAVRYKFPLVFLFLFLVLIPLLPGSVLARNLRMVYFDVFVDKGLGDLGGQRELLTGAMSDGLVSLQGVDILDRAARDSLWKSRKLVVAECEKIACRLESARALSMDLMLEATIQPLGTQCQVRLTVKNARKGGVLKSSLVHKTVCSLEPLMALLTNMAASAWPAEKAQKWKPPVTRKRLLGGGILPEVPDIEVPAVEVPKVADVGRTEAGDVAGMDLGSINADLLVAYDAALKADKRGKQNPETAINAWQNVRDITQNNPYRNQAAERYNAWSRYLEQQKKAEEARQEQERLREEARQKKEAAIQKRKDALRRQQEKDTATVRKLMPLSVVPVEQKTAYLKEYGELYGWPAAAELLGDVQPAEQVGRLTKALLKLAEVEAEALKRLNGFRVNGDDTVTDTSSNLTWQQGDSGEKLNWEDAKSYCSTLSLGGHTDWRLPDKDTLKGLYDRLDKPASGNDDRRVAPFHWSSSYYWSSSTYANNTSYAWSVLFNFGYVSYGNKSFNLYARCVR